MQFLKNTKVSKKIIILVLSCLALVYSFYSFFNAFDFCVASKAKITTIASLKEALVKNISFRNYFIAFVIKNTIILLPFVFSAIRRNTYFIITYTIALLISITAIQFYGTLKEVDIFVAMIIIGNIGLFKILGSAMFSSLAMAPSLFAFALCANRINQENIEYFALCSAISIFAFTACFKIENLIKNKTNESRKGNFYKRKFRKR